MEELKKAAAVVTPEEFLRLLDTQVERGIYVWGGDGELLDDMPDPEAWIRRHETSEKDAERAVKLYRKRVKAGKTGIRAFDCSGLVFWTLKTLGLQQTDLSSRGLYAKCEKIEAGDLRPGDLVFCHDGTQIVHVGVNAKNGYQIECRGRDVGVVKNKRKAGYWNRFGRWPGLTPGPEPGGYAFKRLLKYGCTGEDVIELKKLLIAHGYTTGITIDTPSSRRFGSETKKRVKEYQKAAGLKVDGIAGPDTVTALGGVWDG